MSSETSPKKILTHYLNELKTLKKSQDCHIIFITAVELRDYVQKLDLSYSRHQLLNNDIQYLVETAYDCELNESELRNDQEIMQMGKETIEKAIDRVTNHLDSIIRDPSEIKLKKLPIKKGLFDFLKRKKETELKSRLENVKHELPYDLIIEPEIVVKKLNDLLSDLTNSKKLDVKKVGRNSLLEIRGKYIGILRSLDHDGNNRLSLFLKEYNQFEKYDFRKRAGFVKFDLRHVDEELYQELADWLERRIKQTLTEFQVIHESTIQKKSLSQDSDVRSLIIKTEEDLRNLISSVLTREYGHDWENDSMKGWSKKSKEQIEYTLKHRKEDFPFKTISNRLIDYCYILDLKDLIEKNDKLFKPIFNDWSRFMTYFDDLGKYRNPQMHSTTATLPHEESLCIGICGEFKQIVEHWKKGFSRKILSYSGNLNFDVLEKGNELEEQKQVIQLANNWIDKIKSLSNDTIETITTDQGESLVIKLKEGKVSIRLPKVTRSYNGSYAQTAGIYFETESKDVLNKIISVGQHSYWHLEWIMTDVLDVHSMISKIEENTGNSVSKSGSGLHPNVMWQSFDHYFSSGKKRVRATISSIDSTKSKIGITCDDAMFDNGFTKAHDVFSPDSVLSIVYGEIPSKKVQEMIKQSTIPYQAN